jgi:hypothetical protein
MLECDGPCTDREALEAKLLEELMVAWKEFTAAGTAEKEAAKTRYRTSLERFSQLVVHNKLPKREPKDC